jgi:lipopolysaccharide transport system permease protein
MSSQRLAVAPALPNVRSFDSFGFMWTLTRTDFKTRYHGSFGGFTWALLKPAAMFAVLYAVFSFVFAQEVSYKINLILGLFLFDCFAESTKAGIMSLYSKGYLLTKAKFPSWIVVTTSASNALITLLVFTVVFFTVLTVGGHPPQPLHVLLYLCYIGALVAMVTGISLAGSVLFLRYRDLNQIWDVVIQAGFFLAPIVYPLSVIPHQYHFYLYLWAPTPIIQFSREVLVNGTIPTMRAHALLLLMVGTIFGGGLMIFRRYAPRAAEYL